MRSIIVAFIFLIHCTSQALGFSQPELKHTLQSPAPFPFEYFGARVAIEQDRVLVGAPDDTYFEGKAFLFDADTGSYLRTFSHPTPKEGNFFGGYVGLGAGFAAVMAEVTSEDYSEVFIFDLESGELERTIQFPTFVSNAIGNYKGNSLAVFGRNVLIGASDYEFGRSGFGIAYLYDALTGDLLKTFIDPTPEQNDYFGSAVALNEEYVVIAARGDDTDAVNAGQVFVFDRMTGNFLHSIGDPSPTAEEYFGWSLALDGSTLAVGQPGKLGANDTVPGEVFLFDVGTGNLIAEVTPPDGIGKAYFGQSVALDNDVLVVGASSALVNGESTGQVFLYDARTGKFVDQVLASGLNARDYFGGNVSISNRRVVIGAAGSDWFDFDNGRVYLFELQVPEPTTGVACQIMALAIISSRFRRCS